MLFNIYTNFHIILLWLPVLGETGDVEFCAVHMINEGVVISGRSASLFFQGTEAVESYLCKLRGPEFSEDFTSCKYRETSKTLFIYILCTFSRPKSYSLSIVGSWGISFPGCSCWMWGGKTTLCKV